MVASHTPSFFCYDIKQCVVTKKGGWFGLTLHEIQAGCTNSPVDTTDRLTRSTIEGGGDVTTRLVFRPAVVLQAVNSGSLSSQRKEI